MPVVALAGTCMDSGKTAAACAIISRFVHHGLRVAAFKATGVSLRRDVLAMEDAGAHETAIFTDFGIVTTTPESGPALTRSLLSRLAATAPDVIVFELGDGLLGAYGVEAILLDDDIRVALTATVLCANDPVAAWGGVQLLRDRFGIEPAAVTGRALGDLRCRARAGTHYAVVSTGTHFHASPLVTMRPRFGKGPRWWAKTRPFSSAACAMRHIVLP